MSKYAGSLFGLIAFSLLAIHDVFVKLLSVHYLPFQIVFMASLMAIPLALVILPFFSDITSFKPVFPKLMIMRVIAMTLTSVSAFFAISSIPLTELYALLFSAPILITALSAPILGEQVGWRRWLAVLFGFCGVLVVLQPTLSVPHLGHLGALTAAFGIAFNSILLRKVGDNEQVALVLVYPLIGNVFIMGFISVFMYKPMPIEHLGLSFLVAVFSVIAMSLIIFAYRTSKAVLVAPMQYSQIIWGSFLGWLFFAEKVEIHVLVGATIIISSGFFIFVREAKKKIPASISQRPI
jgi:drug/metabolite transporter (DMT)-like permease